MTNIIITQNNFNGDWRFIPNKNGTKSQLILSKNILTKNGTNENVSYNFNYDVKDHVIGRPTSLMNQLLGLDENQFYKCIIDNNSLTFIVMTQSEINDYNKSNEDKKNKEKDKFLIYFDVIRTEFRNDKLLMLKVLNLYFMRKKIDLENILTI